MISKTFCTALLCTDHLPCAASIDLLRLSRFHASRSTPLERLVSSLSLPHLSSSTFKQQ